MSYVTNKGFKIGGKFRIIGSNPKIEDNKGQITNHRLAMGTVVTLIRDDGTNAPQFSYGDGVRGYIHLSEVELITESSTQTLGDKYKHSIKGVEMDVYDVLEAFKVTCPAMQHALKKMLCAGLRGHKDQEADKKEAIRSIERSIELDLERV